MKNFVLVALCGAAFLLSCQNREKEEKKLFINENIQFAVEQTRVMLDIVGEPTGKNYPRTTRYGELSVTGMHDWTPGFFPGSLWYLYELSGDVFWKGQAEKWTVTLEPLKTFTRHHDLGFMMYCSYGNADRLASKPEYKDILVESAGSLSTRFNENAGVIKSWNYRRAWNDTVELFYPVIIDNMMNLEMLLHASKVSGNQQYRDIAVQHANTTLKNHFRDDFSTYHVVDYDTVTGDVLYRMTSQGYSDNSTWARGQAWAIYGFTMMYRETGDEEYLQAATEAADWYLRRINVDDPVPCWDFNVGDDGYEPEEKSYALHFREKHKDASAAAITCSALFELGQLSGKKHYIDSAISMLYKLASVYYRAEIGENSGFLLKHSVGSIPHKSEIDVPLVYADYYFLEALVRYRNLD